MRMPRTATDVYVEVGAKRAFAGALAWPGWCRSGGDEAAALGSLAAYGERYARVVGRAAPGFHPPARVGDLHVSERLRGDAGTDFGAPSVAPSDDARPLDGRGVGRLQTILDASWDAFERAVDGAAGVELERGPRGGGRDLDGIVAHVVDAQGGYLRRIAAPPPPDPTVDEMRDAVRRALDRAVSEGLPPHGPRGGKIFSARYFVRRSAWHLLDHAWEIEDRHG